MVRDALGEDAIIVATGEERGAGGGVRVTAAVEPVFELGGDDSAAAAHDWLQYDSEEESDAVAEELTDVLLRHGVPEDVMDYIISCATVMGFDDPGVALVAALEQMFAYRPLPIAASKKALMMIGPPGAGKTLAVAKMAARGAMNGLKVGVISADTIRAGGIEQLQAFTNLLNINLRTVGNAKELYLAVQDLAAMDQILIDTPGLNPFSAEEVRQLARMIGAIPVRPILVLPAGTDADESGEMARIFATIGAMELLPTRIDIARRLGGILSASHHGGLSFSDYSNTPKVAEGLSPVTPKTLSRLLMPGAYRERTVAGLQGTRQGGSGGATGHKKTGTTQ